MNYSTALLALVYTATALGIAGLGLVESVGTTFLLAIATLAAATLIINLSGGVKIPPALWGMAALVMLLLFTGHYLLRSASLIDTAARFLALLLLFRLLDLKTGRDHFTLFAIALFLLLAAASSTTSPLFLLLLFLYAMAGIWAMILFNILGEWSRRPRSGTSMPRDILGLPFLFGTMALTVAAFMITMAIFFLMPRVDIGIMERPTGSSIKLSGFSERVELGAIGELKKDDTVVMRIEFPDIDTVPPPLYYRGVSLDLYDGESWSRSDTKLRSLAKRGSTFFSPMTTRREGAIKQRILLEPVETDVLFAAAYGLAVEGNFREVKGDGAGSFYRHAPPYTRTAYTAYSLPGRSAGGTKDSTGDDGRERYLQLPEISGRIKELVVTLSAGNEPPERVAGRIVNYLKINYRYTVNPRQRQGVDPLDDFLFHSREGYCEQFATAMAVMLRKAGIPSRVVNGFLPGEWNSFGNYLLVRQSDAHSWVEAYLPDRGWTLFDPTPAAGVTAALSTSPLALYLDSLRWRWHRSIINYSLADQIAFGRNVETTTGALLTGLKETLLPAGERAATLPLLLLPLLIALLIWLFVRARAKARAIKKAGGNGTAPDVPPFYLAMVALLKKRGLVRRASETPLEFAKRSGYSTVLEITDLFMKIRYGDGKMTPRLMRDVEEKLRLIRDVQGKYVAGN